MIANLCKYLAKGSWEGGWNFTLEVEDGSQEEEFERNQLRHPRSLYISILQKNLIAAGFFSLGGWRGTLRVAFRRAEIVSQVKLARNHF